MHLSSQNYEDMILKLKQNEASLKSEINDLRTTISKLNFENDTVREHKEILADTLSEVKGRLKLNSDKSEIFIIVNII